MAKSLKIPDGYRATLKSERAPRDLHPFEPHLGKHFTFEEMGFVTFDRRPRWLKFLIGATKK